MLNDNDRQGLHTTHRSLAVVEYVRRRNGATFGEIREGLDMAKSTTSQHLRTLRHHGLLRKEDGYYDVGLRFLNLGETARHRLRGFKSVSETVNSLADRTDEEADFLAETAGRAITIQISYDVNNPFREDAVDASDNHWRIGTLYEIHSLAGGKAILSGFETERVREIIARHGLAANTEHTITDAEGLFAELERIRERGYAISDQEYIEGLCAVGCRVEGPLGSVLGALGVNVPKYRFEGVDSEITAVLMEEADALEKRLAGESSERIGVPASTD
jgi:DNA-binding IclR family transcriptional regulator